LTKNGHKCPSPHIVTESERTITVVAPGNVAGFSIKNPVFRKLYLIQEEIWQEAFPLGDGGDASAPGGGGAARGPANSTEGTALMEPKRESKVRPLNTIKRRGLDRFSKDLSRLLKNHRGQWVCYHGLKRIDIKETVEQLREICKKKKIALNECYFGCIDD